VGKEEDPIYCLLDSEAHIAALPTELIDRMATDNLYVETAIPLDAYGGKRLKQGVPTVGLATVLIAPESDQDDKIRDLIDMIQKNNRLSNVARESSSTCWTDKYQSTSIWQILYMQALRAI